jgi:hypothetical protein
MAKPQPSAKQADRKVRRRRVETFSIYIYKVLKQVHPDSESPRRHEPS